MSEKPKVPVPDPRGDPVPSKDLEKDASEGVPLKDGKTPEIEIEREQAGVEHSEAAPADPETLLPPD